MAQAPKYEFIFVTEAISEAEIRSIEQARTEADLWDLVSGINLGATRWIATTYFHLRHAIPNCRLSRHPFPDGVNILHYDEIVPRLAKPWHFIVAIQPDRPTAAIARARLVQNRRCRMGTNDFVVPYWPQPALKSRNPERGDRFDRIGFLGAAQNLSACLASSAFSDRLAKIGIEFVLSGDWRDYRDLDGVLAIRELSSWDAIRKPANKLINCWHAGVIPILGKEPAFWDVGVPDTDYIEVSEDEDGIIAQMSRLKGDLNLRTHLLSNGRCRSREFQIDRLILEWKLILEGQILELYFQYLARPRLLRLAGDLARYPVCLAKHRRDRRIASMLIRKESRV